MGKKSSVGPLGTMWPTGWAKARDCRGLQPSWGLLGIIGATTGRTNQASSLRATSICPAKATLRVPTGQSELGWSQSPMVLVWGDGVLLLKDFLLMAPKAYQV